MTYKIPNFLSLSLQAPSIYISSQKICQLIHLQIFADNLISNEGIIDDNNNNTNIDSIIPQEFLCRISKKLMLEPVLIFDGETYEKKEIIKWFKNSDISPLGEKIEEKPLQTVVNTKLKRKIIIFKEQNSDKLKKLGIL